jgi:hypothetical protein
MRLVACAEVVLAEKIQIPDLWLKMEMAFALAPPGTPTDQVQNSVLVRCVRGDSGSASTFNKWLAGDDAISMSGDGYYMSALLECLICTGGTRSWNHATIKEYAERNSGLALAHSLAGTVADFGTALLSALATRADFRERGGHAHFERVLSGIISNALLQRLVGCTEPAGKILVLNGPSRDWIQRQRGNERLAKKGKPREVLRGDFIQYIVPPYSTDQLVFGYEVQTELNPLHEKWGDIVGWFSPQIQRAGQALLLLDEPVHDDEAYKAEGTGECQLMIVGVDLNQLSTTSKSIEEDVTRPHDFYRLMKKRPPEWPEGYAEVMAMITYVQRLAGKRTRAINANMLEATRAYRRSDAAAPELQAVPPTVRLYQGSYCVV